MNATETITWHDSGADDVRICAIGGRTPLGFSIETSAAAVRGGISAIIEHPKFVDRADEPVCLGCDAGLDPNLALPQRMAALLAAALREALSRTPTQLEDTRVKCWVGLPEPRPGLPADLVRAVTAGIPDTIAGTATSVQTLQRGHASGLMALQLAAQAVSSGTVDLAVAAGVDSYHDTETLAWLDSTGGLMSGKNRNGFPPGEAAGVCLLTTYQRAQHHGLPVLARLKAAATAFEDNSIDSQGACIGTGLTLALDAVIRTLALPRQAITTIYCDLNGQRYRNEEWVYTLLRVQHACVDAHDYHTPADCWGDVGAAFGPLCVALAICASQRNYARGQYPLIWAGSESGYRTAVVLSLPQG